MQREKDIYSNETAFSDTSRASKVQLFREITGNSGEPLVLVHGSWVDHRSWDPVVPSLSQSFRVVTYDRRGHSQSERPAFRYSIRQEVEDLATLIEELDLAPAHIAGTSSGGSIVLRLAIEKPGLFRSMIINEPPLISLIANDPKRHGIVQHFKARFAAVVELLEAGDIEGGVREFVETVAFGPGTWAILPAEIKETAMFNAPTFLNEMRDPEFFLIDAGLLQNFFHPALLTLGELGPPIFPPIVKKLADALPLVERKIFAGGGHEPEQSHPEAYVATISEFILKINSSID